MPVDRTSVRDTAKYLRNVRPIDPAEIREYVEGRPDPRVVRRILREEAPDLLLVEYPDGTFRPVPEGTVRPTFDGVTALPTEYGSVLEDLLVDQYGADWATGESGEHLRETIRRFKADYYRQHDVEYDSDVALGYAVYHLPVYYASAQYVLWDLARDGLLDHSLRVLDVGAGVGGPALGLNDLLSAEDSDPVLVDYHAIEPSDAVEVLEPLLERTDRNFHWEIHEATAETFDPAETYDLILFSNVLSELEAPVAVAERYLEALADDGTMVSIAPADRNTSLGLRSVEGALEAGGATVYAPMVRLWPGESPTADSWSFDERPAVEAPPFQQRLAAEADRPGEFVHTSVKFSYSFVRTDDRRRFDVDARDRPVSKLANTGNHVTDRLDVLVAKLSRDLSDDGHPLYTVSDGSEREPHFAVVVNETELNRPLKRAEYGDLLTMERVLVLWNDDEGAYNLVVDEETVVDPA